MKRIKWSHTISKNGLVSGAVCNSKNEVVYQTEFVTVERLDEIAAYAFETGEFLWR